MAVAATLPNFQALSEFWAGLSDTCGETACLVTQHALYGAPALTGDEIVKFRSDMAAHGYPVQGGTTMGNLVAYCQKVRGLAVTYANTWANTAANRDAIHQTLLDHAGRDGIVLQVAAAHSLPGNEPGVNSHFIAVGGVDPVKGYLVANGDDVNALASANGHGKIIPCRWMTWAQLVAAQPVASAVFPKPTTPPAPPAPPTSTGDSTHMPLPTGWKDDGTQLSNPQNSSIVRRGFRLFILNAPTWEADDVPLENESAKDLVVRTSPEVGAGIRQVFTKTVLGYTAKANVFKVYAGAELLAAEARCAELEAKVAAAQAAPPLSDEQKAALAAAEDALDATQTAIAKATSATDALKKAFP